MCDDDGVGVLGNEATFAAPVPAAASASRSTAAAPAANQKAAGKAPAKRKARGGVDEAFVVWGKRTKKPTAADGAPVPQTPKGGKSGDRNDDDDDDDDEDPKTREAPIGTEGAAKPKNKDRVGMKYNTVKWQVQKMREVLAGMQTENPQSQANLLSTLCGNSANPFASMLQAMAPKPAGDGEDQDAMAFDDAK
eukprot:3325130-Pleurochrysis_carterae.AAC.1